MNKKKSYFKILKTVVLLLITIFSFLWYFFAVGYGKVVYYFDKYELNQVKIDTVITKVHHFSGSGSSHLIYEVHYKDKEINIPFVKKTLLQSNEEVENYKHFSKIIEYEDWLDDRALRGELKNDLIWVYENPYAMDFYAKGETDMLNYTKYLTLFLVHIVLLLISMYGFYKFLRFFYVIIKNESKS